jgi:hypothetical protein
VDDVAPLLLENAVGGDDEVVIAEELAGDHVALSAMVDEDLEGVRQAVAQRLLQPLAHR